ncbi:glycosyltransferase family 47 protein, partial [Nonomuraea jabiensis]|uniref:hypothetical protein n=1 Tax=Nonomuraea jabiensis TaxID=882448 RepID=UPI0036B4FEFB
MTASDLQAALDARFNQLSSDLEKTVKKHVRQALKAEIRQEVELEIRAEIAAKVHREMAVRLADLVRAHQHLDPATILQDFVRQATELLSSSRQPAADTLTQQELVEALRLRCPASSGQLPDDHFMMRAVGSGTRCGPQVES